MSSVCWLLLTVDPGRLARGRAACVSDLFFLFSCVEFCRVVYCVVLCFVVFIVVCCCESSIITAVDMCSTYRGLLLLCCVALCCVLCVVSCFDCRYDQPPGVVSTNTSLSSVIDLGAISRAFFLSYSH